MARNAIESHFRTIQNGRLCQKFKNNRSEMARNAIKSDFRTSKMAIGGHFVKKITIMLRERGKGGWGEGGWGGRVYIFVKTCM